MSDPNFLKQEYNITLDDVMYFGPRFQIIQPFNMAVCLVWSPPPLKNISQWKIFTVSRKAPKLTQNILWIVYHEIS